MSIFTKADIEMETFCESTKKSAYVTKLYEHLDELKSQGIYVVDVSLVSTVLQESSYYGDKIYNEYMIRLVKPKYEVIGETDDPLNIFESGETKSLGYFKSNDEVEKLNNNISLKTTTM